MIGASQFTVQVSGKTIYLPDPYVLPVHNVPVVHVAIDLSATSIAERIAAEIRHRLEEIDLDNSRGVRRFHLARRSGLFTLARGRRSHPAARCSRCGTDQAFCC